MAEMITEVDKGDNVIGVRPKEDFDDPKHIHRSSHLLLFNSKGDVLLQKRSSRKKKYPGLFDYSVSGTVRDGETYEQTLKREIKEELGITVTFKKLFKYFASDESDSALKVLFKGEYEGKFVLEKKEVESVTWIKIEDLRKDVINYPEKYCGPFLMRA